MIKRLVNRPAIHVKPLGNGGSLDASDFAPVCYGKVESSVAESSVSPGVIGLLFFGCPAAVIFAVRAIYVYSINAVVFAGAFAHIFKKIFKAVPAWINSYASPAIVGIRNIFGVVAPTAKIAPGVMLRGANHAMSCPSLVFGEGGSERCVMATARDNPSISKPNAGNVLDGSAIASAFPFLPLWDIVQHIKFSKSLAGEINQFPTGFSFWGIHGNASAKQTNMLTPCVLGG